MVDSTKEKEPIAGGRVRVPEETATVESPRKPEENLEVESWISKIEKRFARIPKGAPGPQDDQVVVQQPASGQPPVKLPISSQGMVTGQDADVQTGLRWLYTWAVRQIAALARVGKRAIFRELPEAKEQK